MKFYRKTEGSVLGGVCLGISEEYNFDVMLTRLAAIIALVLTSGFIGIVYVILWAVLPAVDADTGIKEEVLEKINKYSYIKDRIKNPNIIGVVLVVIGLLILINIILPMELIMRYLIPIALVGAGIFLLIVNNKR